MRGTKGDTKTTVTQSLPSWCPQFREERGKQAPTAEVSGTTGGQGGKGNSMTIFTRKFQAAFFLLMLLNLAFHCLEVERGRVSLTALESEDPLV